MSAPQCPIRSAQTNAKRCPVRDDPAVNPRNNMPDLPQTRNPHQLRPLPTGREVSSIPRPPDATYGGQSIASSDEPTKWEYPSPQQFYNALIRKGWNTSERYVEGMVIIHNRLNEQAWAEILQWEARFTGSLEEASKLELVEFSGIHDRLTHKARIYQILRRWFPSYFIFSPPFDRHDWIVRRSSTGKQLRYVIDYYSSRKTMFHEPEFHLDVRPATDSIGNAYMKVVYITEGWARGFFSNKARLLSSRDVNLWFVGLPLLVVFAVLARIQL